MKLWCALRVFLDSSIDRRRTGKRSDWEEMDGDRPSEVYRRKPTSKIQGPRNLKLLGLDGLPFSTKDMKKSAGPETIH